MCRADGGVRTRPVKASPRRAVLVDRARLPDLGMIDAHPISTNAEDAHRSGAVARVAGIRRMYALGGLTRELGLTVRILLAGSTKRLSTAARAVPAIKASLTVVAGLTGTPRRR